MNTGLPDIDDDLLYLMESSVSPKKELYSTESGGWVAELFLDDMEHKTEFFEWKQE